VKASEFVITIEKFWKLTRTYLTGLKRKVDRPKRVNLKADWKYGFSRDKWVQDGGPAETVEHPEGNSD
jgi:hypothetical protein